MFELVPLTIDPSLLTAPRFREDVWGARRTVRLGEGTSEEHEPALPDSDVPLTFVEMAAAIRVIGTPAQEGKNLAVDPDDYPLF